MNLCPKKDYILHHSKTENKYTQCLPAFGKWVTDFQTSSSIIASEITENFRLREEMPLFFIKYFICRLFTPIASAITGIDNLRSNEHSKLVKTRQSVIIYYLKVLKEAPCQSLLFQLWDQHKSKWLKDESQILRSLYKKTRQSESNKKLNVTYKFQVITLSLFQ